MYLLSQQLIGQTINNPVLGPGLQSLSGVEFISRLLRALVGLGLVVGAIVFFFILLMGAIQWMTSGGDKSQTEAAKSKLTNAFIGIIILFSIFAIVRLVETFFGMNILLIDIGPLKI